MWSPPNEFGWWVRRGGVRIGAWAHARLWHRESDDTMLAHICISLAGLLAEQKFLGLQWRFEEDVIEHLRAVRAGEDEGLRLDPTDLRAVALVLHEDEPAGSLSGARRVVAYCRNQTNALLDEPRVWGALSALPRRYSAAAISRRVRLRRCWAMRSSSVCRDRVAPRLTRVAKGRRRLADTQAPRTNWGAPHTRPSADALGGSR